MSESVRIEKLVHGGQGLGTLADGRKVFVWNALPGELVKVDIYKSKNKLAEGVATEIIEPSKERAKPLDEAYLSTSPWQIMTWAAEKKYKQEILTETFAREKVTFEGDIPFHSGKQQLHYRNKMEYSFWADDHGLHLALYQRASHSKLIVEGSSIARPEINEAAKDICATLNKAGIRGSQLKTVVVRCNQQGEVVAAVFAKDKKLAEVPALADICRGLVVYYSNPKSPASVISKELYKYGDIELTDVILDTPIKYDVNSFFQVNVPVFEAVLGVIKQSVNTRNVVDMYSGVGTIGVAVDAEVLVELDEHNVAMAKQNVASDETHVVQASTEKALEYITAAAEVIFDPPRAGLHPKVIGRVLEVQPKRLVYLSCNPSTQARDLALLQGKYKISSLAGYNFFPRTPHIESLAILDLK